MLTKLTVRINHPISGAPIGSGTLVKQANLNNQIYILTAAHCLYDDGDNFEKPLASVSVSLFNPTAKDYKDISVKIDHHLVSPNIDGDLAILTLKEEKVEAITGALPTLNVISDRLNATDFVLKGFPSATKGLELAMISPSWVQSLDTSRKFQLYLNQDFSTPESARYEVEGFSGSGVFVHKDNKLYLFGVFSRFLEAGKIIYCEYIDTLNNLLAENYLPTIDFTFFGPFGLTNEFFNLNAEKAIKNLGPRFNEKLNFDLPINKRFNEIAKDDLFRQRVLKVIDHYITAGSFRKNSFELLQDIDSEENCLHSFLAEWMGKNHWSPEIHIDEVQILNKIDSFSLNLDNKLEQLYDLQDIHKKSKENTEQYSQEIYQAELSRVRELSSNLRRFRDDFSGINFSLANNASFLLIGEAGTGKSHLLGDVISGHIKSQKPGILLLGQLFKGSLSIWTNILQQLGLNCTKDEFLLGLDEIGKQVGSRIPILIDAINEGPGKVLWTSEIAGFLHEISKYHFISIVLSIRTTYYSTIIPKELRDDESLVKVDHKGFNGNEYEALKVFCRHFGIHQPNFPILAPEYTNPLFLQLICIGVKASEEKIFPQGFQGLSKILKYYLNALHGRLVDRNPDYSLHPNLLQTIIHEFSIFVYNSPYRIVYLDAAVGFFNKNFPRFPSLLRELIEEGFYIKSLYSSEGQEDEEVVYFSYERLSDFFIAQQLLSGYKNNQDLFVAFQKENTLGKLSDGYSWWNSGILEAFAILLPEKFGLEIFEVFSWVFEKPEDLTSNLDDWLNQWLIDSLKWRNIESIDDKKIIDWFNSPSFQIREGNLFYFLLGLTAVKNHPFNSDRLHKILSKNSMAQRDGFWQLYMEDYHGLDDNNIAFPITRLIEWAWEENISANTDDETARLVGQSLAWVLSSTNRGLRDQITKSMVNLFQLRPKALIRVLDKFKDIDDLYIKERLFAVVYGVALKTHDNTNLKFIAQYVFDVIFKDGTPIAHLLLRDYARNCVEYAISKGIALTGDLSSIHPPYGGRLPKRFPTSEEVEKLKFNEEDNIKYDYARIHNLIHFSVLNWDFGNKIVDSALRHFHPVRFTYKQDFEAFRKGLKRGGKTLINSIVKYYELAKLDEQSKSKYYARISDKFWDTFSNLHAENENKLLALMDDEQISFYRSEILPWLELNLDVKFRRLKGSIRIDGAKIKNWIVQRVFSLGYDVEIHGNHDSRSQDYDVRTDSKVERIGKKYQWIALHEILALMTDNYKLKDTWSNKMKLYNYSGPWQFMLRDIDPSFTYKHDSDELKEDDLGILQKSKQWYSKENYHYWNRAPKEWAESTNDLPNRIKSILKIDTLGNEWMYLSANMHWDEPKQIGEEKYYGNRKEIHYIFQAYLVPKRKKDNIVKWLCGKNFYETNLPENDQITDLFIRENFWSSISKENRKESSHWKALDDSPFKVMPAAESAVGELSNDKSGAHFYFNMPCKKIYEGLNLRFASKDGDFENNTGKLIATNISQQGLLIRKDNLVKYLEKSRLAIIWTLIGEKNALNRREESEDFRKVLSGVYHFENDKLQEYLSVSDW